MSNAPIQSDEHATHIGETAANGARRVGFVWVLAGSLVGGAVMMAVVLLLFAGSLSRVDHRGGVAAVGKADAARMRVPPPPNPAPNT